MHSGTGECAAQSAGGVPAEDVRRKRLPVGQTAERSLQEIVQDARLDGPMRQPLLHVAHEFAFFFHLSRLGVNAFHDSLEGFPLLDAHVAKAAGDDVECLLVGARLALQLLHAHDCLVVVFANALVALVVVARLEGQFGRLAELGHALALAQWDFLFADVNFWTISVSSSAATCHILAGWQLLGTAAAVVVLLPGEAFVQRTLVAVQQPDFRLSGPTGGQAWPNGLTILRANGIQC